MPQSMDQLANLPGRVAVVTGGAGGLGQAASLALAEAGVSVAVCDRDEAALDRLRADLERIGHPFLLEKLDVRDSDALAVFFQNVIARFEKIHILVNVPGGSFRAPFLETSAKGVGTVIRQNFTYVVESIQHSVPQMPPGSSIINVTSVEGHRAVPMMSIYGAMKAAVAQLDETLAVEFGPLGIRVNAIAPDHFPTEATIASGVHVADESAPEIRLQNSIHIPLQRTGTTDDFAKSILFLASDLSSYLTGTTMMLTGGTTALSGWMRWPSGYTTRTPRPVLNYMVENNTKW